MAFVHGYDKSVATVLDGHQYSICAIHRTHRGNLQRHIVHCYAIDCLQTGQQRRAGKGELTAQHVRIVDARHIRTVVCEYVLGDDARHAGRLLSAGRRSDSTGIGHFCVSFMQQSAIDL